VPTGFTGKFAVRAKADLGPFEQKAPPEAWREVK
jgi:hypothetical protein